MKDWWCDSALRLSPKLPRPEGSSEGKGLPHISQQKNNPTSISRPTESDHDRGFCPSRSALRNLCRGVNIDEEPVRIKPGFKDSKESVEQDEATLTPPNENQRRSISSQVAAVNATEKKLGAIWHQLVSDKTSSLILVERRISAPCRQDYFLYKVGLGRARNAVLLWFTGFGVFTCGMFP